jgi:flagellar basal body-associated protein FliL
MNKKATLIVITIVIVGIVLLGAMMMRMRRGMMSSDLPLMAVSSDGTQIPLSDAVKAVTGELPQGTAAQQSGDMIVLLTLNPYPPTAGMSDFTVTLTDTTGQAINDATIALDLSMPAMRMPPNQPDLPSGSDGKYSGTAPFTMRGWWRIEVIITRGGQTQSVFFDVGL